MTSYPSSPAYRVAPSYPSSRTFTSTPGFPGDVVVLTDATVAVTRGSVNPTLATSVTDVAVWATATRYAGWRDNFGGSGTARHAGARPYFEGDGTSDNPGASVTQAMSRFGEIGGGVVINFCSYNSATGNIWPDPTSDCPAASTGTYAYYGYSASSGTGAIAFVDGDGYFHPPSGANGADTSNPWATLDLKIMQARAMYPKSKIILCMRACPAWMTTGWNASTVSGDYSTSPNNHQIDNATEPQRVNGGPPLWMNVVSSGTYRTDVGFGGVLTNSVSSSDITGVITAAGTGPWGSGHSLTNLLSGDSVTFAPGTTLEETHTLTALDHTTTGAFTITGSFANSHAAGTLVVKNGGQRILSGFFGGNTCSSGDAASGFSPGTGNVWTFFHCMARLVQRVAERYPFITTYFPWGEPGNGNKMSVDTGGSPPRMVASTNDTGEWLQTSKTFWDDDSSGHALQASPSWTPGGRNNIVPATILYNLEWQALKNASASNLFGGPYHACSKLTTSANTLETTDQGVHTVFFNNARTPDFIVFDGFGYGNGSAAGDTDPIAKLATLADNGKGLTAAIAALKSYAATWGYDTLDYYQAETYYDSATGALGSASNWFTSDAQAMCLATILLYSILGGSKLHVRWSPQGDTSSSFTGYADPLFGNTYNLESLVSTTKNSDAATTGLTATVLGQPFPLHAVYKSVHDNFGPGTALKLVTVTDGSATPGQTILALASGSKTMIVNQYNSTKIVGLKIDSGPVTPITVGAYSIVTI